MIVIFWFINAAISALNAWVCGRTWNETKHVGGFAHFMNWCTAIMSACGFTWCYLVIMFFLGSAFTHEVSEGVSEPYVTQEMLRVMFDLGYLVIYFPIVGTGLAMTIEAWAHFLRKRTLGNGAVVAWDTFAMIYNISSGLRYIPEASGRVGDFFKGDHKDSHKLIVVILVALALVGGILTTYWIVKATAKAMALRRAYEFDHLRDEAASAA